MPADLICECLFGALGREVWVTVELRTLSQREALRFRQGATRTGKPWKWAGSHLSRPPDRHNFNNTEDDVSVAPNRLRQSISDVGLSRYLVAQPQCTNQRLQMLTYQSSCAR